jgi:hypothetical protein
MGIQVGLDQCENDKWQSGGGRMSGFLSPSIYGKRFSQNGLVPIGHLLAPYLTVTKNSALSQMIDVPKLVLGRGMMSRRRFGDPHFGQVLALKW